MKFTKVIVATAAIFTLSIPAMASNDHVIKKNSRQSSMSYLNMVDHSPGDHQLLARGGRGRGGGSNGAGNGTGHKYGAGSGRNGSANGPRDGSGQGSGAYGPGDGAGNGGSGPKDGTGNGAKTGDGDCPQT